MTEQVVISNPALPQPISLFTETEASAFASAEDETKELKAYDRSILEFFRKDEKFMGLIQSFAKNLDKDAEWVLDKFVKILMYLDKTARKLFVRKDITEENFPELFEKYLKRYRTPVEDNYVPSTMASNVYATLSRVCNFSGSQAVDETLLSYVLPMEVTEE